MIDAQRATARHDAGARHELRQRLVDLAAIAELLADELPASTV
jgi:hypothetical protein